MLQARRKSGTALAVSYFVIACLTLWAIRHAGNIAALQSENRGMFTLIYFLSFVLLFWQTILYISERPHKIKHADEQRYVDSLRVVANVPVCNEDAPALKDCLESMLRQTRRINVIHVVVNGPNKVDYTQVKKWAIENGVKWDEQTIAGKRQAQAATVRKYLYEGDIFLSVDSDAYLDSLAVEEGLKPFAKKDVMSVAGIVLTMNNRKKFLTRMSDLWFLVGQLVDRSAHSAMGAVLVNSGVLAFYRAHIMLDNLEAYTNETFFGRPVEFSDDSMLTIYALQKGRTVQQTTSFAFTLMPENMSHHIRQQLRWMRGAFIRSWWRFRYLPLKSYAYWAHLITWCQFFLSTYIFFYLFFWLPVIDKVLIPYLLLVPLLIGYGQALRYLTVWRSDESVWYRVATFVCAPIPALWSYFVLRWVRWYAMITCLKTGWGTRQDVEVRQ